jgi:hypothetical protein
MDAVGRTEADTERVKDAVGVAVRLVLAAAVLL